MNQAEKSDMATTTVEKQSVPERLWKTLLTTTEELQEASKNNPIVFSGGACNLINAEGALVRGTGRDKINKKLSEEGIYFFDPQIEVETHGEPYNYEKHSTTEQLATQLSEVDLYELSETFGGVTQLEIIRDLIKPGSKRIVFINGEEFSPAGIDDNEAAQKAHFKEYTKNGNSLRKNFLTFMMEMKNNGMPVKILENEEEFNSSDVDAHKIKIVENDMQAAEIVEAFYKAAKGEKVTVFFEGGLVKTTNDKDQEKVAPPAFSTGEFDPQTARETLAEYKRQGNEMRKKLLSLIEADDDFKDSTKIVYTAEEAADALIEMYKSHLDPSPNDRIAY